MNRCLLNQKEINIYVQRSFGESVRILTSCVVIKICTMRQPVKSAFKTPTVSKSHWKFQLRFSRILKNPRILQNIPGFDACSVNFSKQFELFGPILKRLVRLKICPDINLIVCNILTKSQEIENVHSRDLVIVQIRMIYAVSARSSRPPLGEFLVRNEKFKQKQLHLM